MQVNGSNILHDNYLVFNNNNNNNNTKPQTALEQVKGVNHFGVNYFFNPICMWIIQIKQQVNQFIQWNQQELNGSYTNHATALEHILETDKMFHNLWE